MNRQEVFDKIANHLLTQNKKSVGDNRRCAYRGVDGLMCAIGCLITDEAYDPFIEGRCSDSSEVEYRLEQSGFKITRSDREFLKSLQVIHDSSYPKDWEYKLKEYAKEELLEFNWKP